MVREPPSLYSSCLVAYVRNLNYSVTSMDRTVVDLRMLPTAILASVYEQVGGEILPGCFSPPRWLIFPCWSGIPSGTMSNFFCNQKLHFPSSPDPIKDIPKVTIFALPEVFFSFSQQSSCWCYCCCVFVLGLTGWPGIPIFGLPIVLKAWVNKLPIILMLRAVSTVKNQCYTRNWFE